MGDVGDLLSDASKRGSGPVSWSCLELPEHAECRRTERMIHLTGPNRPRTVASPSVILAAAAILKALHPEPHFPLRKALAWRFGCSIEAIRKALQAARRSRQ